MSLNFGADRRRLRVRPPELPRPADQSRQTQSHSGLLFFRITVFVSRVIRALIFDFDGLILDTETPLIDAYADVHAAHGLVFDRTEFLRGAG